MMKAAAPMVRLPGNASLILASFPNGSRVSLAEDLVAAGIRLNTRCGCQGQCSGCLVKLIEGNFRLRSGINVTAPAPVKACAGQLDRRTDAIIEVPSRSLIEAHGQISTSFEVRAPFNPRPPAEYRRGQFDHGLAIDIGTTTVVVALVDLWDGKILAQSAGLNRQVEFGDNVVTRIQLASDPVQREKLREAVVHGSLEPLIRSVCAQTQIAASRIATAVVAGNTTMLHLLVGDDTTCLGIAPFKPQFLDHRVELSTSLGLETIPASTPVHLLPGFSAFVGADVAAGCLCSGLTRESGASLLLDIGTNGEIVLSVNGRLIGTATAAGPAFEGGRLECGTRAVPGAISHVKFSGPNRIPEFQIIPGAEQPVGLAGSAYLDVLAQGRASGLIDERGRFSPLWTELPSDYKWNAGAQRGIMLRAGDALSLVTEGDIAQLQQAKAAIAAGVLTLLQQASLLPSEIEHVFLAGGFGQYLDPHSAVRSGLLPGFVVSQIETLGNTALGGAWLALIDGSALDNIRELIRRSEILELSTVPAFEDTFIDQLALP